DALGVTVVDFELRGRHLRVVLLVLEAHGALNFGGLVDELAQLYRGELQLAESPLGGLRARLTLPGAMSRVA
ncbi:MAG TPA: hypothetical protein PK261_09060, partial [Accumulibacter sp.]|nr:hypothetical protein [Accumulibacter sp.]